MFGYKSEVFLIKGKYYSFTQNHMMFPLIRYGAIENGLTIDDSVALRAFDEICADVLIMKHESKWGLFPMLEITGQGCADWASTNDTPFIYDSFKILSYKDPERYNETFDSFILLNEKDKWSAVKIVKGKEREIELPVEPDLESCSDSMIIQKLEQKYGIVLEVKEVSNSYSDDEEDEEVPVFDDDKDFMKRFDLIGDDKTFLRLIIGLDQYDLGRDFLYAVAHKNMYAAILIGKSLLSDIPRRIAKRDSTEQEKELEEAMKHHHDIVLNTCMDYFKLGKKYAVQSGNTIMSEIADVYIEEAQDVYNSRHPKPLGKLPFLKDRIKKN